VKLHPLREHQIIAATVAAVLFSLAFLIISPLEWLAAHRELKCPDGAVLKYRAKEALWCCIREVPRDDPRLGEDLRKALQWSNNPMYPMLDGPFAHYDIFGRAMPGSGEFRENTIDHPAN